MDHHLEPLRRRGRDEGEQLLAVHVVRRGDPLDTRTLKKLGRELVGDVERKIGDDRQALRSEKLQAAEVADEHAIGLLLGQQREDPQFVGLLDPRRGGIERATGRADKRDRVAILADVGEVGIELPLAEREDRLHLRKRSHEDME